MYNQAASFDINFHIYTSGFVIYNNKRFTKKESSNKFYLS